MVICPICKAKCKRVSNARGNIPTVLKFSSDYRSYICRVCRRDSKVSAAGALLSKRFREAKDRCTRPNVEAYKTHGGRGIKFRLTLCKFIRLYIHRTMNLLAIGQAPSLNRKDPNGDYEWNNIEIIDWAIHRLESYTILSDKFKVQRQATHKVCTGPCKRDLVIENFAVKKRCTDDTIYRYPYCNDCRKAIRQDKGQGERVPVPGYFAKYIKMKGWENPGWDRGLLW